MRGSVEVNGVRYQLESLMAASRTGLEAARNGLVPNWFADLAGMLPPLAEEVLRLNRELSKERDKSANLRKALRNALNGG